MILSAVMIGVAEYLDYNHLTAQEKLKRVKHVKTIPIGCIGQAIFFCFAAYTF